MRVDRQLRFMGGEQPDKVKSSKAHMQLLWMSTYMWWTGTERSLVARLRKAQRAYDKNKPHPEWLMREMKRAAYKQHDISSRINYGWKKDLPKPLPRE